MHTVITLDVSAVTEYDIGFFDNWFTSLLFSNSSLVVGQRIFIGANYDGTTFKPEMISLRRQGIVGDLVQNSVSITSGNRGSFQLQNNFLLGYVLAAPLTVPTGDGTNFININGLAGLQAAGSAKAVTRGLGSKIRTPARGRWGRIAHAGATVGNDQVARRAAYRSPVPFSPANKFIMQRS